VFINVRYVYGLLRLSKRSDFRIKTRTYIRLFDGEAISQPSMYAHPDTYLRRWTLRPQSGAGFIGVDIFIWSWSACWTLFG